jgi:uncharacterized protein with FMN-binding domain
MKKMIYVVVAIVFLIVLSRSLGTIGMDTVRNLQIANVDLSRIADGIYEGRYQHSRWDYSVRVTVKDHRITAVTMLDENRTLMGRFTDVITGKYTDELAAKVASQGTLKVDAVSGPTVSQKALLKAIENALTAPPK